MKIGMQRAGLAGMACLLGACAVGPDYVPPRPSLPAHYAGAGQWVAVSAADPLERGDWWRVFGDAQLDRLMQRADDATDHADQQHQLEIVPADRPVRITKRLERGDLIAL